MLLRRTSLLLLGALLHACGATTPGVDAGSPHEADSELAQRFPGDTLPWPVSRDATAPGLLVTAGVNAQLRISEPRYKPLALAVDRLGVVFPPGDRPGFDLAVGGFGQPWQREPLTTLAAGQVASLDAVPDGLGGAWVGLRLLDRREQLVLLHWTPGRGVQAERLDFPVGLNPLRLPYLEACNDLVLGVSPAGDLDLVVRSDPNPLDTLLFHGRRARGAGAFTWSQVVDGRKARAPVPQGSAWDFGCKSALTYDGLGRAVLAVLVQQTSTTNAGLTGRHTAVFTEGKDGRFWPKETAFMTIADDFPSDLRGLLDLASHPSGYVFGGPAVAYQSIPAEATLANPDGLTAYAYLDAYHPYFPRSTSFTGRRLIADDFRFVAMSGERLIGVQSGGQPVPRRGGKLLADGCGQFALAVTDWDEPDTWSFNTLGKRCLDPRPAPVFRSTFSGTTSASFSHGYEAPFSVGVCLDAQRQALGVCFGGHVGLAQAPTPVAQVAPIALVSASLTNGQAQVPLDAGLTLEFAVPLRDPGTAAEVYDLDVADRLFGTWALVPGSTARYAFSPRTPLKPANHYRLVVPTQNLADAGPPVLAPWQTTTGRFEVIDFTTGGAGPVITDAWGQPFGLSAQHPRDDAGVPVFTFDDRALVLLGSEPVRLLLTGQIADDYGRTSLDAGRVLRPDGGVFATVSVELDSTWIDVPAPRDAGEEETWLVELPAFFDRHGRAFEDHVVRLETRWFPLAIRSAVPAPGSTVSAPPAEVRLAVNRPDPEQHTNASAFTFSRVEGLDGGGVLANVPFTLATSPFELRLVPSSPLQAGASYRVVNLAGTSPVTVTDFTVAP